MQLTLTPLGDAGVEVLPPDIVWNGRVGDFAIATSPDQGGVGGLVAANPLKSAVLLLLFTDCRAEDWELRFEHRGDRRGWPGDGFDVDRNRSEGPLGSKLWLFRRHELTDLTGMEMAAEVRRALQPLVAQGAVVRIDALPEVRKDEGVIATTINLYGRDGRMTYSERFDPLWRRVDGGL